MAVNFLWGRKRKADFGNELRDKTEKIEISNAKAPGFKCGVEFGNKGVFFKDAKYKSRGFEFFLDSNGFLVLEVRGPGGGVHDCRITDDTAMKHRLEATKGSGEEKRKMVLWMVKEMQDDLISPRGSFIKTSSMYRKELLRWMNDLYHTINSGQVK